MKFVARITLSKPNGESVTKKVILNANSSEDAIEVAQVVEDTYVRARRSFAVRRRTRCGSMETMELSDANPGFSYLDGAISLEEAIEWALTRDEE
jgi:hypothetical protein